MKKCTKIIFLFNFLAILFSFSSCQNQIQYEEEEETYYQVNIKETNDTIVYITEPKTLTCKTTPKGVNIKWSSNKESIATVDETGTVTGVAPGEVKITASVGSYSDTVKVKVVEYGITLEKKSTELLMGETERLNAIVYPEGTTITWSSNNTDIATVDNDGVVTSVSMGSTTIKAEITYKGNTYEDECVVTVVGITVPKFLVLNKADSKKIEVKTYPERSLVYTSQNIKVATVNNDGFVTGVSTGMTFITIKDGDNSYNCIVSVTDTSFLMNVAESKTISTSYYPTDSVITWTSSDTSIATVDSSTGKVTAVASGTAIIAANILLDGIEYVDIFEIIVIGVNVPSKLNVTPGFYKQLKVQVYPEKPISYSSNDTSVATIDSTGKVKGVAIGSTTITVTVNGVNYTTNVNVLTKSVWESTSSIDTSWVTDANYGSTIEISDASEVAGLSQLVREGKTFNGVKFVLDNDIVVNDDWENYATWGTNPPANTWTRIGYSGRSFRGEFDGQGHTIYGMYIDSSTMTESIHVGFIGDTDGATVKNINIVNCYIKSNKDRTGGVVGWADNGSVIENCTVSGIITSSSRCLVAGIVGHCSDNVTIRNCVNYANITSTGSEGYAAGITSDMWYSNNLIENCINYGNITVMNGIVAAGILAYLPSGPNTYVTINNCQNYGTVYSKSYGAGGIVAYNDNPGGNVYIINCTNAGNVSSGSTGAGGIVGYNLKNATIYNCKNSGTIIANSGAGGILGYSSSTSTVYNCVNTGAVSVTSGTNFGGIEGQRTNANNATNYTYYLDSTASKGFGNTNYGSVTGCGTFTSIISPVALMYDVTGGTQGTSYTTLYVNNSTTNILEALNGYVTANPTVTLNGKNYTLLSWTTDSLNNLVLAH